MGLASGGWATPGETVGFNSGVIRSVTISDIGNITVYICSSENGAGCNGHQNI